MGCTVSGVERKNYERCVWNQEKSKTSDNSEHFSLCGKGHEENSFKNGKRRNDLGTIIILRTTDLGRNVVAKKIRGSTRNKNNKESSNSSQVNKRVALSSDKNKELCGVDQTHEASHLKAAERCNDCRVPWNATCTCTKKQDEWKNAKNLSKAELGCNFEQDTAGSKNACFKFYISDCNNNPTSKRLTTPSISEFYSCMQNGLHVDIMKSDQCAVSVHESFFNAFEDDCDDDDFMLLNGN